MSDEDADHWLVRPGTIRSLWVAGMLLLAVLVLLDAAVPHHPNFTIDGVFGFGAWYGFGACVGLVVLARLVGLFLKRPDTYYDE